MRTLGEILATLREVLGQDKSAAHIHQESENDYRRAVVEAIHSLKAEVERQTTAADRRHRHEKQTLVIGWLALAVNAITMGAVIYYAYVARGQLQQTMRQLDDFEAVEGAHLSVERPRNGPLADVIGIALTNSGRLPSPRATLFAHVYKFSGDNRILSRKTHTFGGDRTPIPPGTDKYGVSVPLELQPGEREKVLSGTERIDVFVVVRYDNGFKKEAQLGYCWTYVPHVFLWDKCTTPVVEFSDLTKTTPGQ